MIQWKGFLSKKRMQEVPSSDTLGWKLLNPQPVDKLGSVLLLSLPLYFGVKALMAPYDGSLITILFADVAALLLCGYPIMMLHELLHAIGFGRHHAIQIWFYQFGMVTHCAEAVSAKRFLLAVILPNLILSLPMALWLIFEPFQFISLVRKTSTFVMMILVLGAYSDLSLFFYVLRNRRKIKVVKASKDDIYYEENTGI